TVMSAQLTQATGVVAHAVFTFGRARDVEVDRPPSDFSPTPFESVPVTLPVPPWPTFAQHFEYRVVRGKPITNATDAITEGWVRIREPGVVASRLALIVLVDAWFPSLLPTLTSARPFGTISFAAHFFDREWQPNEPLYHRSRMFGFQEGY